MCDSFVALPSATRTNATIAAKNADCEINEAQAVLRLPRRSYPEGAMLRATHLVIPQARQTHEVIIDKSFWTWGGEIGLNEHGVAVGNEAIFSLADEKGDGLITGDLLRIMLERAATCAEAIEVFGDVLSQFGQGGNCELRGNAHFNSSYLVSDRETAFVIESSGRDWAAKEVTSVGAISNAMTIRSDWQRCTIAPADSRIDFAGSFEDKSKVLAVGAHQRRKVAFDWLKSREGTIDIRTMTDLLRQHPEGFDPVRGEVCTNICMHAGPYPNRLWQACGAMIMESSEKGAMAWVTATSGTCVSVFKPLYFGVAMPDTGPIPTESFSDGSLWWKHEKLHRRAMANFHVVGPEIRECFEKLEERWFATGSSLVAASAAEKTEFMSECWREAKEATDRWIANLERRNFTIQHEGFANMWNDFNAASSMPI